MNREMKSASINVVAVRRGGAEQSGVLVKASGLRLDNTFTTPPHPTETTIIH